MAGVRSATGQQIDQRVETVRPEQVQLCTGPPSLDSTSTAAPVMS